MAPQKGKDLLLKIDPERAGSFVTVAGLRTHTLSLNAASVDVTNRDSAGNWRELLAGTGLRSAQVRGSGIFRDETSDEALRRIFFDSTIVPWQIVIPGFGVLTGDFHIAALEYSGRHDGELSFELALESAGAPAFASL
jgi:TP901-1 family phage major tail protein